MFSDVRSASTPSENEPKVWGLVVAVAVAAALLHVTVVGGPRPLTPQEWGVTLLVAVAFGLAEVLSVHVVLGRESQTLSLSELPLVAGLLLLDPFALVLARVLGPIPALVAHRRQRGIKVAFNLATLWLEVTVALAVWLRLVGPVAPVGPAGWWGVIATVLVTSLVGGLLLFTVIALRSGRIERHLWTTVVTDLVTSTANATFALVAVILLAVDVRSWWMVTVCAVACVAAYRAWSSLRRRHATLERLAEFTRSVGRELHTDAVVLAVADRARAILQAEVAELVLWDRVPDGPPGAAPVDPDGLPGAPGGPPVLLRRVTSEGSVDEARTGAAAAIAPRLLPPAWDGTPVLAPRDGPDPVQREALAAAGCKDAAVAALWDDDRIVGSLLVAGRRADVETFDRHDATLLVALAQHAGMALENGRLADRLRDQAREREYQALHDALTGLPNRTLFRQRVAELVAAGNHAAVLLMDLDRFKEINDTLGHHTGDQVLVEVARRLRNVLPGEAVMARLGGDEFVVCLADIDRLQALRLADRLRRALSGPVVVDDVAVDLDMSVGIALAPQHGILPATLLQRADIAMYGAKTRRAGVQVYTQERDEYSPRRLALVGELRRAIDRSELLCHFQPQVACADRVVVGVEALIRWEHPERGLLLPDDFIAIAEQTGLIRPLTLAVLREALGRCRGWRDRGLDLGVAVNLSPRSLLDPLLVSDVEVLLDELAVPHDALTLELTESSMVADPAHAGDVLRRLSGIGVRLSVDDFGTGFSPLSYLKHLPVDEIKIDKSFVRRVTDDPSDGAIVGAIVDLSHQLGKRVVAEGVEDRASFERLAGLGCDTAQGYWLSRPVTAAAFDAWVDGRTSGELPAADLGLRVTLA